MKTYVKNPDGTPFYVDLGSPSSVTVTIGEAYTLAASLRGSAKSLRDFVAAAYDGRVDPARWATDEMLDTAKRLDLRADAIESVLVSDKERLYDVAMYEKAYSAAGGS